MTGFSQPERRGLERIQSVAPDSHPDADLLAAFSENSLTAREQGQVLAHLAACSTCREILALAGSQLVEPVPEPLRKRGMWEMPLFHWGAAAATAIVVIFAIAIGVREYQPARQTAATATFNEVAPATPALAPQSTVADKVTAHEKAKQAEGLVQPGPTSQIAQNTPAPQTTTTLRAKHLQEQFRYERPADESQSETQNLDATDKKALAKDATRSQGAPSAADLGATKGAVSSRDAGGASAYQAKAETQPAAKQAPGAPPQSTPSSANEGAEVTAQVAPLQAGAANARNMVSLAPLGAAQLQIASNAQLQRSTSQGWENVLTGHKILAFATAGNRMFAGGANGQLFASDDNGAHWTPIAVHDGDTHVNGNITQLHFSDAQNGTLGTSAAETWTTSDGGHTWHKQ